MLKLGIEKQSLQIELAAAQLWVANLTEKKLLGELKAMTEI